MRRQGGRHMQTSATRMGLGGRARSRRGGMRGASTFGSRMVLTLATLHWMAVNVVVVVVVVVIVVVAVVVVVVVVVKGIKMVVHVVMMQVVAVDNRTVMW